MQPSSFTTAHSQLLQFLSERMGLELIGTRRDAALSAIRSAMAESDVETFDEYYERITSEDIHLDRLIDAVSVGETYFFREPAQFEFLRNHIITGLQDARGYDTPIHCWSAGCASGEEAYSIAILLEDMGVSPSSRVLGTDISKSAIEQARAGLYRAWSLRTADAAFMDRYFSLDGLNYRLCDRIRERAIFERHNLTAPVAPDMVVAESCDVIFLRNVLIYFGRDAATVLIERLVSCLTDGGWLITASCDPPIQGHPTLESISSEGCVFYRHRKSGARTFPTVRSIAIAPECEQRFVSTLPAAVPTVNEVATKPHPFDRDAAEKASRVGDYVEVIRLTADHPDDPTAKAISIRATANLTGSLGAYRECDRSCRDHPFSVELHYLRGLFLFDLGRSSDAADAFRRVVYLDPTLALAHFSLGTILAKSGDISRARRAFQTAHGLCMAMDPDAIIPLTEHEPASRLAAAARSQIDGLAPADDTAIGENP